MKPIIDPGRQAQPAGNTPVAASLAAVGCFPRQLAPHRPVEFRLRVPLSPDRGRSTSVSEVAAALASGFDAEYGGATSRDGQANKEWWQWRFVDDA